MNLIVAIDQKNGIGKNGDLLCRLPSDLKNFKALTVGKTVIMGYNTLLSLPHGAPLKDRTNIVLYEKDLTVEGAAVLHSTEELLNAFRGKDTSDVFVIGGAMVYSLLMPYCDTLYITHIHATFDADRFLPPILPDEWECAEYSPTHEENGIPFHYAKYTRK